MGVGVEWPPDTSPNVLTNVGLEFEVDYLSRSVGGMKSRRWTYIIATSQVYFTGCFSRPTFLNNAIVCRDPHIN